jgi:N-acetylmuramoyl-L-alanine amidase
MYMEARGEPRESQIAVAAVVMNRVKSKEYPGSVCKVVHQKGQFTWKKNSKIKDKKTYLEIKKLASLYLAGKLKNPIGSRLYFNNAKLGKLHKTPYRKLRIKNLVFY